MAFYIENRYNLDVRLTLGKQPSCRKGNPEKDGARMGKTGVLGSFEELVLLAVLHQGADAYSVTIRRELEERSGARVSMGAVHATLDRLEEKGLIRSGSGDSGVPRRGRPRRYYALSTRGASELERTRRIRATMWQGIDLSAAEGQEA
jgi:DNA-binding PadR family transcriptional regulator